MSASSFATHVFGRARKSGVKDSMLCWTVPAGVRKQAVRETARLNRRQGKLLVSQEAIVVAQPEIIDQNNDVDYWESRLAASFANDAALEAENNLSDDFDEGPFGTLDLTAIEMSLMPGEKLEDVLASGFEMQAMLFLRHEVRNTNKEKAFRASSDDEPLDFIE